MPRRACWGAEAAPVITERRQQDTCARQRHRAFLQRLQDRKAHEREREADAAGTGAAMHEREVGFSVLFNGANQRSRADALTAAHRGRLPLQIGCVSPSSLQHHCQLVDPPPTAMGRKLAVAGFGGAHGINYAEGLPRRRRWSLEQPVAVLDTHTGDLLRVNPQTRRLLPALVQHGSAGPVEGMPAPLPAVGARPLRALLQSPTSPERHEEKEEAAGAAAEEEDAEAEEAAEGEAGARDAARDCICARDSDPDGSQPVDESAAASAVDAAAPTPPWRAEIAVIRGRDDHFEHDTLRPLYPTAV